MHVLPKAQELIEKEVEKLVEKGTLSPAELENLHKAVETMYKIECLKDMHDEGEYDDGYSDRRGGRMSRNYDRGMMRTSRRMYPMDGSYADRSYDRGMSRADSIERTIDVLESMLDTANSEKERRAIMNHIEDLKR